MVSAHNPFRTPAVSPNPTGTSSTGDIPDSVVYNANSHLADRERSSSPQSLVEDMARGPEELPPPPPPDDIISEELPPAYTPSPNVSLGETTLEAGPRRPFQEPPRHPQHQYLEPIPTGWQSPQFTGSGWSSYPGRHNTSVPNAISPPRHPLLGDVRPSSAPNEPMSDFARDFYAAGTNANGRYAPPPGEPPRPSTSSSTPSLGLNRNRMSDDGRPTEVPTPGRPLLRHGKLLVYPTGHECAKCHNTGYKNNDPSHPCTRCWEKYSRPFTGALAYTPWGSSSSSVSARNTLQRPLPNFTPPHVSGSKHRTTQSYSSPAAASSSLQTSSPHVIPIAGGGVPMSPYLDPLQRPSFMQSPSNIRYVSQPPAGAAVLPAGDPRLGGRLCWRCGGSGIVTFLIFDESPCNVCNGIGRTYQ
ncbi:hypothetical protein AcW1_006566 [Taiwanofungus camphoratus]|nr:hypothetical protein AcV5_009152 [Antrodia cinnamomea]KAI0924443.1 hypothetical protein AcW2_005326 [Antrodia cinnamomea]KAI0954780.1 hypothetical protein AcW1_006566 [Antrodia cinnamomea]